MLLPRLLATVMLAAAAVHSANADMIAHPQVALTTSEGRIVIELDAKRAPLTAERFVGLVRQGYYDGLIFHRVVRNFVIQAGGYDTKYESEETDEGLPNESGNGLSNLRGTVAMARTSDPHSAGAQFFINIANNTMLNPDIQRQRWGYAVFGRVIEGMDIVDTISSLPTGPGGPFKKEVPALPVIIEKATVITDE
ncbi:MAG: peptidylprolyl isomerase [Pseudomonadota bacterium]